MTKVSLETCYKFDILATKDAVQDAFDNAGLVLALKEAVAVIRTLSEELRQTRQEYKAYVVNTERILSGLAEYRQQSDSERKQIAKDVVEYWLEKASAPKQPVKSKTVIFLSADKKLYREPESDLYYRLEADSGRARIIRTLMSHKNYMPTESLVEVSGLTSRKSLEGAVQAINRIAHKKLKITKLIEGFQDSGYRLCPDIILKKE